MPRRKTGEITVLDRLTALSLLTVLQPVTLDEFEVALSKQMTKEVVNSVVEELVVRGLVLKVSDNQYVVTYRGLKAPHQTLRKKRDILRMLRLSTMTRRAKQEGART